MGMEVFVFPTNPYARKKIYMGKNKSENQPSVKRTSSSSKKTESNELISKRKFNLIQGLVGASEARRTKAQLLGFTPRDFVLCGLPYKRYPGNEYERRNGNIVFRVVAEPKYGLPFGQDRLIPIWLATAFVAAGKPEDNIIWFRCMADMMRTFGLGDGGLNIRLFKERIRRVFGATYFVYDSRLDDRIQIGERYHLVDKFQIEADPKANPKQCTLWQSFFQLSQKFADDIRNVVVPIDLNSVKALKARPIALDLYIWQAWRSYRLTKSKCKEVAVPMFGEEGLAWQLGTQAGRERKIREQIKNAQKLIKMFWRDCPNFVHDDKFIVRSGFAVNPKSKLHLPGVSDAPTRYPNPLGEDHPDYLVFKGDRTTTPRDKSLKE